MAILVEKKDIRSAANYATPIIVRGDILFDNGGKLMWCSGLEKLSQSIQRELSLIYRTSTNDGNEAFKTLEESTAQNEHALNRIRNDFTSALLRLQSRQGSKTPPAEQLTKIAAVLAEFDETDPTTVIVGVAVINALRQSSESTFAVNSDTLSVKLVN